MSRHRSLSRLAVRGARWVAFGIVAQRVLQVLAVVVLARLLQPRDFGVVTLAVVVVGVVSRVRVLGMHSALIQRRDRVEEAANAYFVAGLVLAVLLYGGLFAAAPLFGHFFKSAEAAVVLRVAALQIFMEAFAGVQRSLATREMNFRLMTGITLAESVVSAAVSVLLAAGGHGVWALVLGSLAGMAAGVALWWVLHPWRPTGGVRRDILGEMVSFGVFLTAAALFDSLLDTLVRTFVGRFQGVTRLGYYDFTQRIITQSFRNLIGVGHRVALPAFCRVQEDLAQMRAWYLRMIHLTALVTAPGSVCLLLAADLLVPAVFGPKWLPAVPLIRILSPLVFLMPLLYAWPVYVATERQRTIFRFTLARLGVTVPLLIFAAARGLTVLCAAELILTSLFAVVNLRLVTGILGMPAGDIAAALKAPAAATAVLAAAVAGSRALAGEGGGLATLLVVLGPAGLLYAAALHLFDRTALSRLWRIAVPPEEGSGIS